MSDSFIIAEFIAEYFRQRVCGFFGCPRICQRNFEHPKFLVFPTYFLHGVYGGIEQSGFNGGRSRQPPVGNLNGMNETVCAKCDKEKREYVIKVFIEAILMNSRVDDFLR
jgi:hypothetical protein